MSITAFDIDGVMVDFTNEVFVPTARLVHPGLEFPDFVKQESWDYRNVLTPAQEDAVWKSPLLKQHMLTAKPIEHAIHVAHASSPSLCSISSRGTHGSAHDQEIRQATINWLHDIGFGGSECFFVKSGETAKTRQVGRGRAFCG